MFGIVHKVPCQPGSQPQVVADGKPHFVGVMAPWLSHAEHERVHVDPKESWREHVIGQGGEAKLVGGVARL